MSMSASSSDSDSDSKSISTSDSNSADPNDEWGITYYKENAFHTEACCPTEPIQVVNDAFDAIAGTLYNKQRLDPAIAHNARSNSLYTHRPTRSSSDAGRIGIEIDGAEFLFTSSASSSSSSNKNKNIPTTNTKKNTNKRTRTRIGPNSSQRRISLILAAKLSSNFSWRKYENNDKKLISSSYRPVVLSFNTIKEALLARREMQFLQNNYCRTKREREAYNHIIIQTLSDGIPKILQRQRKYSNANNDDNFAVNATKGLLVVVQPTDFNQEFNPPVPSLNTINDLQTTIARAFIQQIPVIVLSPRFLSYGENENKSKKSRRSTNYDDDDDDDEYIPIDNIHNQIYHNQNGFFQQASFYGGTEPPRGPAPFILRDL
ncbi:MAG: hypothetical protein ACI8RD_007585 [Bacillariaceae sp.]|jgi:hypothetical protein